MLIAMVVATVGPGERNWLHHVHFVSEVQLLGESVNESVHAANVFCPLP